MEGQAGGVADLRLEGLLLCDGTGACYEVPRVVIERYRVARQLPAPDGAASSAAPRLAWVVAGGIYAPALGERHPEQPHPAV